MKRAALVVLILLLAMGVTLGVVLLVPFGPTTETFVDIPSGTGTSRMGALLEAGGVIRSRYGFALLRVLRGGRLRAGEYRFDHPVPLVEVYRRVARGDVYTRTVVVRDGSNLFDVAQAVEAAGLGSAAEFLAAERSHTELIRAESPHATSLEGFLYPDTYRFSRHATAADMLSVMVRRWQRAVATLDPEQAPVEFRGAGGTVAGIVTIASLIEKEVGQSAERPLVAGVFLNRLRRGMPLETDPSVVYAALLEGRYRGTIYASDLRSESLYNTYRHTGLPPGPVANPGLAAMRAAIHPATTDALYFVSDGAGHTRFAATLAEHQGNVEAYRRAIGR